jgi:DNA-binding response OmpR family regulator
MKPDRPVVRNLLLFIGSNGRRAKGMSGRQDNRTIFLIEEDDETRKPLVSSLRGDGYHVIAAIDEEDAFERVGGSYVHADLVLVNLVGKSAEEALSVGRKVRDHARYDGQTPLVVMPEKYGKDVEGTDVNVAGNDWIHYLGEDPEQLKNLLARLLPAF